MADVNSIADMDGTVLMLLPLPEPTSKLDGLRAKFPRLKFHYHEVKFAGSDAWKPEKAVPIEYFEDATALFTLSEFPPDPKKDAPKLEWIQLFSAGADNCAEHPVYTDTDITITTCSGVHGPQIAEWVIMTALIHSHKYNEFHDYQKQHVWAKKAGDLLRFNDMAGQRIGVLGYGSIGRQVARMAKAMGMDVLAFTASPRTTDESKKDYGYIPNGTGDPNGEFPSAWFSGLDKKSLHNFLDQDLDILLVSLPLTEATTHFIGMEEFSILKKRGTFISNISRGQIVDQSAMITALQNGDLRGAALDVTDPEPLPTDNPLWDMPNVVISPHVSGLSSRYLERSFAILEGNLEKKAKGETLWNVVHRKRGY